jgi:predicted outer membrane protein
MRRITVVAITALLLAGCASNAPQRPAHTAAPAPVVRSIAISPADYMAAAASTALFIVKASEQIAAREGDTGLGQSARQFQSEQLGIGAQLSLAGRRVNLLPSAALLPRHQALLDELSGSADPGATYVRQMKSVLPQAVVLHRQYERYGTSPTLRPVAGMAAPVNERELAAIRRF